MGTHSEPSLVRRLRERGQAVPHRLAYRFHHQDGSVATLTYGQLAERARRTAWSLRQCQEALERQSGDRSGPVLLLYPPGLDYVVGIFACLAAGLPAVPAYPPDPQRLATGLERLAHVAADARPAIVLADRQIQPVLDLVIARESGSAVIGVGETSGADETGWPVPCPGGPDGIAIVQYTSGSTRAPKGVIVRHASLDHNIAAIARYFGLTADSKGFSWLPPYHDMGLVGGILTPMVIGFPVELMSPADFLSDPISWLRKIGERRITATGGPNFAYDLCVRRVSDAQIEDLDLSSWQVAFNGAEPVRWQTMAAFAQRFQPAGFQPSAFFPCYGLAEATLIVSGSHWDGTVRCGIRKVGVGEIEGDGPGSPRARVSCGTGIPDQHLVIVDPDLHKPARPGSEGEVWLRGPSVTTGYWSAATPDADVAADELFAELDGARFLRTGDRGYLARGELVITGRVKDVIVKRGVNYHAVDLEDAAVSGDPRLRPIAAAFAAHDDDPDSAVVIVLEARDRSSLADPQLPMAIRARVAAACGLVPDEIVIAAAGSIPRTSSGKVQRSLCREHLASGRFPRPSARPAGGPVGAWSKHEIAGGTAGLTNLLRGVFAAACDVPDCGAETSLFDIGGDSLRAAEIAAVLENALDLRVSASLVLEALTPRGLTERLADLRLDRDQDQPARSSPG